MTRKKDSSKNPLNGASNETLNTAPRLLLAWFTQNARDLPWRRSCDPYGIWISEIMLQQTQVKTVIPYWERWMTELPDIKALAQAPLVKILKLWEGLGYYSRARNAQAAAKLIVEKHDGVFPHNFQDVLNLPGIGRYTAGAICSIAFNMPTPILDGNVTRVLSRCFGIAGNVKEKATNAQLWNLAQELVKRAESLPDLRLAGISDCALQIAENFSYDRTSFAQHTGKSTSLSGNCSALNQSLMELGALVCMPHQPDCSSCPLNPYCIAHQTNRVDNFPHTAPRPQTVQRRFIAFIVEREQKFLVQQRPAGVVNGGFWEFPNIEVDLQTTNLDSASKPFQILGSKPLCKIRHSIMHYRIQLEVYRADTSKNGTWKSLSQLQALPMTAAHQKILKHLV